jgi:hypothetical protein
MGRNVCGRERTLRFAIGLLLVVLGIAYGSWIIGILGGIPILTAMFSYCPINQALGRNSCSLMDGKPIGGKPVI